MNEPVVVNQKNQKALRFEEPVGQIRNAERMALESSGKKPEEEERQAEEDALPVSDGSLRIGGLKRA